ncbi:hypothetical protein [Bradyrhizobium tropiciagri]|nr:hypothetical protein [Bradyrhizobium tropiciagri]
MSGADVDAGVHQAAKSLKVGRSGQLRAIRKGGHREVQVDGVAWK